MPWASPTPRNRPGTGTVPTPQITVPGMVLPPVGINQVDPLAQMDPRDAIYMYNMIADRYGTRVRTGYAQYATTVGPGGVKTLVPYVGSASDGSLDRLYAVGTDGFYNITSGFPIITPARILAFPGITNNSGMGIWCAMTTVAGFFTTYCDEEYGYYRYTEATDSWVRTTGAEVTNVNPNNLVFSMIFKSKLWFIEKNSSRAWYLPTGAVIGAATVFDFGNKFRHGGSLQALYNWTLDGGIGVDDYLVAVSSSGEVIIYKGNDPNVAGDFNQVGSWFIGPVPVGRRIAGTFGGDLYLLSVYGLLPISKLIEGAQTQIDTIELTRKISPAIKSSLAQTRTTVGWEVKFVPSESALMISSPQVVGQPFTQYAQSLNAQGWSTYLQMPIFTIEIWQGVAYFGALDGNVYTHTGDADNVTFAGASTQISSLVLSSFQDANEPGVYHQAQFIRPVFLAGQPPSYTCEIRYDYNIAEVFVAPVPVVFVGSLWDVGIWDLAIWTGDPVETESVAGAGGIGRAMAVVLSMQTYNRTTLIRYDVMYNSGGLL